LDYRFQCIVEFVRVAFIRIAEVVSVYEADESVEFTISTDSELVLVIWATPEFLRVVKGGPPDLVEPFVFQDDFGFITALVNVMEVVGLGEHILKVLLGEVPEYQEQVLIGFCELFGIPAERAMLSVKVLDFYISFQGGVMRVSADWWIGGDVKIESIPMLVKQIMRVLLRAVAVNGLEASLFKEEDAPPEDKPNRGGGEKGGGVFN
jgi:hypothetical protein